MVRSGLAPDSSQDYFGHGKPSPAPIGVHFVNGAKATLPSQASQQVPGLSLLPERGIGGETVHRLSVRASPLPPERRPPH